MSSTARARRAETSDSGTVPVLTQMNVFGLLPVVPQVVDRLAVTCVESWGE